MFTIRYLQTDISTYSPSTTTFSTTALPNGLSFIYSDSAIPIGSFEGRATFNGQGVVESVEMKYDGNVLITANMQSLLPLILTTSIIAGVSIIGIVIIYLKKRSKS